MFRLHDQQGLGLPPDCLNASVSLKFSALHEEQYSIESRRWTIAARHWLSRMRPFRGSLIPSVNALVKRSRKNCGKIGQYSKGCPDNPLLVHLNDRMDRR